MLTSDFRRTLAPLGLTGVTFGRSLAVAAGLGLAVLTAAQAQEATPPAGETTATVPTPTEGPAVDLSMGQEVQTGAPLIASPDTAQIGDTYLAAPFGLWEQRCVKTEDGSDPCQLYQLLRDETGGPVAEVSLFDLPQGAQAAAGATVIVPLETLLTSNLQIAIDGGKAKLYPYTFCAAIGCVARIGLTQAEVEQFRKGAGAVVTIVPAVAPDQTVNLTISLAGFTAGFKAVTDANADVQAQ